MLLMISEDFQGPELQTAPREYPGASF